MSRRFSMLAVVIRIGQLGFFLAVVASFAALIGAPLTWITR